MAIKIDLLPQWVGEKKKLRLAIAASLVSLGLLTTGLLLAYHSKQLELETAKTNLDEAKRVAALTADADAKTTDAVAKRAGFDAASGFMLASSKTGTERAALVNLVAKYIYQNSVVKSIDISDGKTVNIVATVTTPDEYINFLLRLRKGVGVVFKPTPTISGVPGFPNAAANFVVPHPDPGSGPVVVNYPITINARAELLNPITVPADPAATGATATGAPGGPPGGFPGGPGGPQGGPPGRPPTG